MDEFRCVRFYNADINPGIIGVRKSFRLGQEPVNLHLVMDAARHVDPNRVPKVPNTSNLLPID